MSLVPEGFDYSSLAAGVAKELQKLAGDVRERHRWHIEAVIDTGKDLLRAKDILGHGAFLPWVIAEFRWSERTAQRYMSVASEFDGKSAKLADLDLGAVYALAAKSTPERAREHVLERLEAKQRVEPAEVKMIVQEEREAKKKELGAKKVAAMKPDKKAAAKRKQAKADKEEREWREKRDARAAATVKLVELIRESLGDRLGELIELLDQADVYALKKALAEPSAEEISDAA